MSVIAIDTDRAIQTQQYIEYLAGEGATAAQRETYGSEFGALPHGVRDSILAQLRDWGVKQTTPPATKPASAARVSTHAALIAPIPSATLVQTHAASSATLTPSIVGRLLRFAITDIRPSDVNGQPGAYSLVFGNQFDANCTVLYDGSEVPTTFVAHLDTKHANVLSFEPPDGTSVATTHQISVKTNPSGAVTDQVAYLVVAPRGYRGLWGYQFSNFGDPQVPWDGFVDFFGHDAIYDTHGSVRPSAFWWYALVYQQIGGGGNCYGMSVSSLRWHNGAMGGFHRDWYYLPANYHKYLWWFPWRTETKQTVQEDQGGQLSAEMATYVNSYSNSQDAKAVWNRIAHAGQDIVMGMWGSGGHAVVPYKTAISGDSHKIILYDNNVPYSESESNGPDPTSATVGWAGDTFGYGGYNKAVALTYDEVTTPPHLPSNAAGTTGSLGSTGLSPAGTSVFVVTGGAPVNQITDEAGHRFYAAGGAENQNQATRIPLSMHFLPLTGKAPLPGDPKYFLFSNSQGKSLTFDIGGGQAKTFAAFMPGAVITVEGGGAGGLQVTGVAQPTHSLVVLNPAAFRPTRINVISAQGRLDRSFGLTNFSNLGAEGLTLTPSTDGGTLEIRTVRPLQFDLELSAMGARGLETAGVKGIALQAGQRATIIPADWNNITGGVRLQVRGLQGAQILQERSLKPVTIPTVMPRLLR